MIDKLEITIDVIIHATEDISKILQSFNEILEVNEDSFEVATADGKLRINEITYKNVRTNTENTIESLRDRLK